MIQDFPRVASLGAYTLSLKSVIQAGIWMMLLLTPFVLVAGDTTTRCCAASIVPEKGLRVALPSSALLQRADDEITENLYRSLTENRIKKMESDFERSDNEIDVFFNRENWLTLNMNADESDNQTDFQFRMATIARTDKGLTTADESIHQSFLKQDF